MPLLFVGIYAIALAVLGLSMSVSPFCSLGAGAALLCLLVGSGVGGRGCARSSGKLPRLSPFLLGILWAAGTRLSESGDGSPWPTCLAIPLLSSLAVAILLASCLLGAWGGTPARREGLARLTGGCLLGCWVASLVDLGDSSWSQLCGMCLLTVAIALAAVVFLACNKTSPEVASSEDADDARETPCGPFLPLDGLLGLEGYDSLTPRERAVLHLSIAGRDVRTVAADLGVAPSTVSSYRARCCEKLGVETLQDVAQHVALTLVPNAGASVDAAEPRDLLALAPILALPLLCLASRAVPTLAGRQLVAGAGFVLAGLPALLGTGTDDGRGALGADGWEASSLLDGAAMGLVFAEGALCTVRYLAPYSAAAFLLVAAVLFVEARGGKPVRRADLLCGSAVAALTVLSSSGVGTQLGRTPLAALLLAAAIALLAAAARREEESDARAAAADVVLLGQGRVLAYLQGRGLGDLQAKTALLTALGLDLSHVADALSISKATVSSYRTKAYKALGVHDRAALAELLASECGFKTPGSGEGRREQ